MIMTPTCTGLKTETDTIANATDIFSLRLEILA